MGRHGGKFEEHRFKGLINLEAFNPSTAMGQETSNCLQPWTDLLKSAIIQTSQRVMRHLANSTAF
jgi:hypothetical protein